MKRRTHPNQPLYLDGALYNPMYANGRIIDDVMHWRPEKLVLVENGNGGGSGAGGGEVTNKILFLSGIGPYQYSPKKLATYLEGLRK